MMKSHRILCYGDSNTYGYDPRSYLGGRYPKTIRWTALLEAAGWTVFNEGENGRCIPRQDWAVKAALQDLRRTGAEALVVMLGCNDLLQEPGRSAGDCGIRMERFLTSLLECGPSSLKTLLTAPPPMTRGAWVQDARLLESSRCLGDVYRALANRLNIAFADGGSWGVGLAFDGVHFSPEGHRAFAGGMHQALTALFQPEEES